MKRKDIDTLAKKTIKSFEGAKKKAEDLEALKTTNNPKNAGAPIKGQSKSTNQIRFTVDDETLAWLETRTNTKERTPHAVVKKILIAQFELANL